MTTTDTSGPSTSRFGSRRALILFTATAYYYSTLPEPQALFDGRARGSVTMLDRDGRVFAWRGETFGTVSSDKIAPVLKNAVVATEDKRFYSHLGVDPRGVASAIKMCRSVMIKGLEALMVDCAAACEAWDVKDPVPAAQACVALLSDWFPATTGEIVHVDGGVHAMGV